MSTRKKANRTFQMVAGISLNGKIAGPEGSFKPYSSPEDQSWLQKKIAESDVLLMGRKTYEKHVSLPHKPIIIFSRQLKGIKIDDQKNAEIHWFNDSKQELTNLCNLLQYQKVTILGGAQVYHWCLEQKLVTDVYLTIEPFVINQGKNLVEGPVLPFSKGWKLHAHKKLNDKGSLLLHYHVQ